MMGKNSSESFLPLFSKVKIFYSENFAKFVPEIATPQKNKKKVTKAVTTRKPQGKKPSPSQ
jgi:hypothetical protein